MGKTPGEVTILLVDDDSISVRLVTRALRKSKVDNEIVVADDGVMALDILRGINGQEPLKQPYLILLDIVMPRMDGHQFLEEIRNDPKLRGSIVFVLTTSNNEHDMFRAYDSCVAGYIVKSEVGTDFMKLVQMLEPYTFTIKFPPATRTDE